MTLRDIEEKIMVWRGFKMIEKKILISNELQSLDLMKF